MSMKSINILTIGFLFSVGITYAQTTTQPVQQSGQITTQPANRIQNMPAGQSRQVGNQQVQTAPQRTQQTIITQTPATTNTQSQYQNQSAGQVQQTVETVNGTVDQQTQVTPDGQTRTTTTVPNSTTTIQETTTIPQQVNNGQVPKVYTNTQEQLPFRQYQPKPTGQISPAKSGTNNPAPRVR